MSFEPAPTNQPLVQGDQKTVITSGSWRQWFDILASWLNTGYTGSVVIPKLTPTGSNGSMVYINGILITVVQAT